MCVCGLVVVGVYQMEKKKKENALDSLCEK